MISNLWSRTTQNNVPGLELIGSKEIQEKEPACLGTCAVWSSETVLTNFEAIKFQYSKAGVEVTSSNLRTGQVLSCAGLYSDRVASLTGCGSEPKIVPLRGEYLLLTPEKAKLIKGKIYPVPDPRFPFHSKDEWRNLAWSKRCVSHGQGR